MQIKSDIIHHNWEETNDEKQFKCHTAYDDTIRMVDEAEAKWESECCEWFKYDYRTIAPRNHDVKNPYWRIPENMDKLKYCPYCGKRIKISEVE